jgi:hypothetical protein
MDEPRTEAGKRIAAYLTSSIEGIVTEPFPEWRDQWHADIAAIEAEARAAERARIRAAVEGLACECVDHGDCGDCHDDDGGFADAIGMAAVLAIIEPEP